jgi:hypothetical protein
MKKSAVRRGTNRRTRVNLYLRVGGVEWIDLAKDSNRCPGLVNTVMMH